MVDAARRAGEAAAAQADVTRGSRLACLLGGAVRLPVLVVVLALSAVFCAHAIQALPLAWPITNPEGANIAAVLRVRNGEPLYQDFRLYPYLTTPYQPMLYLLGGLVSRWLDQTLLETMATTRAVTFVGSLAAAGLIYCLARAIGVRRLAAVGGAGLFLPVPFMNKWGFAVRPDVLAVTLVLLAALLLLRRPDRAGSAAAVAAIAFLTKQTMVAFPLAVVVWLWLEGRRGDAGRFVAVWSGLVLSGFGVLHWVTDGAHVLNVIVAQIHPTNGIDLAFRDFLELPREAWLPVGLASGALVVEIATRRRPGLLGWHWLAALGVALFTLRGRGSDVNYFIESSAVAAVLSAVAIGKIWRRLDDGSSLGLAMAAALAGAALLWGASTWAYWDKEGGVHPFRRLPIVEIEAADRVLSEEPLAMLLAGKAPLLADPFHLSQLVSAGTVDLSDLIRRIKARELDLIVLRGDVRSVRISKRQPIWPEEVRVAIKDHYSMAGRVGLFWLYTPQR